jgi:UDP:flavonoid glycosyltransferase YjiC (YdhE family)
LLPYAPAQRQEQWFDNRLNRYSKIILVTQGTVEKDVNKILVPALEAFKDSDTLVIATTGGSQTKELRLRYSYDNIIIEDFIPFEDVMPYADVYITNGGYGGVMLSIENNIPMVVAGLHEGKNEICARVGYFKLGVNLKTEKPSAAQLKKAVETVTGNETYRAAIMKMGREFMQYHPLALCAEHIAALLPAQVRELTPAVKRHPAYIDDTL